MDLSPNDIRTYEFPSQMRGYDKDEVDNFLDQAAQALENTKQENLRLSMEIDSLKAQVSTIKEYEDAIKKAAIDARKNADATVESAKTEAGNILIDAKEQAESIISTKVKEAKHLEKQLEELDETKKSFISEIRKIITTHHDKIDEIAQADIKRTLADNSPNGDIEVTDSSDITRDSMETVADTPKGLEETNNDEEQKAVDPELAAALENYQKPHIVHDDTHAAEEKSMAETPKPGEFVETDKSAEDVPDEFIVGNEVAENKDNKTIDTDKVNVASDDKSQTPPPNIAEELDNVVAKFEEEMDKAEKK